MDFFSSNSKEIDKGEILLARPTFDCSKRITNMIFAYSYFYKLFIRMWEEWYFLQCLVVHYHDRLLQSRVRAHCSMLESARHLFLCCWLFLRLKISSTLKSEQC